MATQYEKGLYEVQVTNSAFNNANNKGNPEIILSVKPLYKLSGKDKHEVGLDYERTIFLVLTDATVGTPAEPGWVLKTLQHLGWQGATFESLRDHNFAGQVCKAQCDHETYNGKEREKWNIQRGEGSTALASFKPIEDKTLRGLDAKFGKTLKAFANSKQPVAPPQSHLPEAVRTDDIPF